MRARDFVLSVMPREPEPVPGSDGMFVMRGVVMLETESTSDVIIRNITRQFWQACIDEVDRPDMACRVCAVGTSGIGKTMCTPYLIKMLLDAKKAVVYHVRTKRSDGWFYEFKQSSEYEDCVIPTAYSEQTLPSNIPLLSDPETYYVVDPGDTTDSCAPSATFLPKVIIVAAPDERHWGGSKFFTRRGRAHGKLKVFPVWELDELLQARPILGPTMSDEDVENRYSQVGGVPRDIFASDEAFREVLERQRAGLNFLTAHEVKHLAYLHEKSRATFDESMPPNSVAGFRVSDADDGTFSRYAVDAVAPRLVAEVLEKYAGSVWHRLRPPAAADNDPWFFEAHARYVLVAGCSRSFYCTCSYAIGEKNPPSDITLGGCIEMRSAQDVVAAARQRPMVLFHPLSTTTRDSCCVDFLYQDRQGHFFAFRVVAAGSRYRTVRGDPLQDLAERVGGKGKLTLCYMVPAESLSDFETRLVMDGGWNWRPPGGDREEMVVGKEEGKERPAPCSIYHVKLYNPSPVNTGGEHRGRRRSRFVLLPSSD